MEDFLVSHIDFKHLLTLQGPTNSSLLNETHSRIYEGLRNCSRLLLECRFLSASCIARAIKPKVKVHWAPNASPRYNKRSPVQKVSVECVGGWSIQKSHQSPQSPLWMPFTFSSFLLHASKLHVRRKTKIEFCNPSLSSAKAMKTLLILFSRVWPSDRFYRGFRFLSFLHTQLWRIWRKLVCTFYTVYTIF